MGKQRRKEERSQRRHLRLVQSNQMPGRDLIPSPTDDELETRPEYIANMKAWRDAGCPPGPGAFDG